MAKGKFCIRYADRVVVDARPKDDPENTIQVAKMGEYVSWYDRAEDAYRQAVNDLYHGKMVLGIEDVNGKVVIDVKELHAGLVKAQKEMEKEIARGFGPKAARQVVIRELTP